MTLSIDGIRWHSSVALLPVSTLLPTEEYNEKRVCELYQMVMDAKIWRQKIAVHDGSHVIMDGHHRLEVAKRLFLKYVPCALFTYDSVEVESRRPDVVVTPEEIIARGKRGCLFPEKTTKHLFRDGVLECEVPLRVLTG